MNDPIRKTLTVPLNPSEAFTLFTKDMDTWWPKASHSVKGPKAKLAFPDHKDGDIVETGEDGEIAIWGTIIAYDPGNTLHSLGIRGGQRQKRRSLSSAFRKPPGALCAN